MKIKKKAEDLFLKLLLLLWLTKVSQMLVIQSVRCVLLLKNKKKWVRKEVSYSIIVLSHTTFHPNWMATKISFHLNAISPLKNVLSHWVPHAFCLIKTRNTSIFLKDSCQTGANTFCKQNSFVFQYDGPLSYKVKSHSWELWSSVEANSYNWEFYFSVEVKFIIEDCILLWHWFLETTYVCSIVCTSFRSAHIVYVYMYMCSYTLVYIVYIRCL